MPVVRISLGRFDAAKYGTVRKLLGSPTAKICSPANKHLISMLAGTSHDGVSYAHSLLSAGLQLAFPLTSSAIMSLMAGFVADQRAATNADAA